MTIEVGDPLPNLSIAIRDSTGALAPGGAVTLTITLPDQSIVSPTISNPSTGNYSALYVAVQTGPHAVAWTVTGANAGVFQDTIYVDSHLSIVSLAEVKAHLKISRSDDDELLRLLMITSSNACESSEGCNRVWRRTVVTNEVHTGGSATIQLFKRPVLSITSVVADGSALTTNDYDLRPSTGTLYSPVGFFPYQGRLFTTLVSYVAGSNAIPPLVRDGVLEMVRHLYGTHRGGSDLPRQDEPDWSASGNYLIPFRVKLAWQAYQSAGL